MNKLSKIIGNSVLVVLLLVIITIPLATSSLVNFEQPSGPSSPDVLPSSTMRDPKDTEPGYVEPAFYGKTREELYQMFLEELEETRQATTAVVTDPEAE
jgi:biopolymer transport protein ExbD